MWQRLDRPDEFVLREHGAGRGALATAIKGRA
jgi:SAM-dependent MidA family methyltransferase